MNPIVNISPGVYLVWCILVCCCIAEGDGGNCILDNNTPEFRIIRIVVLVPNPDDDELPPPVVDRGIVTVAIGPPFGHPASNVVVVVDNNLDSSDVFFVDILLVVEWAFWCARTVSTKDFG